MEPALSVEWHRDFPNEWSEDMSLIVELLSQSHDDCHRRKTNHEVILLAFHELNTSDELNSLNAIHTHATPLHLLPQSIVRLVKNAMKLTLLCTSGIKATNFLNIMHKIKNEEASSFSTQIILDFGNDTT